MPTRLYLSELNISFEWVSAAGHGENSAYASRESGRIFNRRHVAAIPALRHTAISNGFPNHV